MPHRKRLLLVEDDPQDVELTLAALSEIQLADDVVVLRDGEEALEYLLRTGTQSNRPEGQPAVTLLDIKMPKVSGLEVLRQIRAHPSTRLLPIVMLTSSREESDLLESYRLGANAYVVKPVEFGRFGDAVREIARFWALVNEVPPGSKRKPKS